MHAYVYMSYDLERPMFADVGGRRQRQSQRGEGEASPPSYATKEEQHNSSTPCYLLTRCGGFIGSAFAAHFFSSLILNIKYWCWADLVEGIGFPLRFGRSMHFSKIDLLEAETSYVHEVLRIVSDPLVVRFDSYSMYLVCSAVMTHSVAPKTRVIWQRNFI